MPSSHWRNTDIYQRLARQRLAQSDDNQMSFGDFVRGAWPVIDAAPLRWSWHLDEMCDLLGDAARRRYRGESVAIVIAAPPGATKSRPISILWQPWVWTWWPGSAWITTSWDEPLAYTFSDQAMALVRSRWYQERWPLRTSGGASRWTNSRGGRRVAAGVRSRVTGDHGHFLVIDDPIKEQLARLGSPVQIADAVGIARDFWFGTMGSRAIDHVGCRVIAMQMLHIDDPASMAIRRGYEHLVLPVTAELAHPLRSPRDHRQVEGEMLCDRYDQVKLDAMVADIGPSAAAAQLWQRPQPSGGQLLRAAYMEHRWTPSTLPAEIREDLSTGRSGPGRIWISYWDLAFKSLRQSRRQKVDYVVGQVWCGWRGRAYLIDEDRGQWGYRESRARLELLAGRYPQVGRHLLEDAANAAALEDDISGGIIGIELCPHGGGALARTQAVEGMWASGAVVLPADAPWIGAFIEEHLRYSGDGATVDDRVSASSGALLELKSITALPAWYTAGRRLSDEDDR